MINGGFLVMDKEKTFEDVGQKIALLRKQKNMTQVELARKLNISQAMITAYETGRKGISLSRLIELADIFEVSPDDILGCTISEDKRRGPISKLDKQLELIKQLPSTEKKAISTVLDMALSKHAHAN